MKFAVATAFSDPSHYVPIARAAEAAGFAAVAVSDHVIHPREPKTPYPYTPDGSYRWEPFTDWLDPWVAIGAMAAATETIRFFTNIYVLPMRNPLAVAKQVATAGVLSGDRVALGIGMGWCEEEFDLLEQPFRKRGRRADEMLEVMKKVWAGGWVSHHGEFYDFEDLEMSPTPGARVPVWVGGISDPAKRRAAAHDGWIGDMNTTDELAEIAAELTRLREHVGRSDEPFELVGSPIDAFDLGSFRKVADTGTTMVLTLPWFFYGGPTDDLDAKLDGIARFGDEIIAKL